MAEDYGSASAGNPDAAATPAASAAPAPTPAPAAPATPVSTPWIDSVANADTKAWAESKGLQNGTFENVLGSYHNLEKMMGADKAGRTVLLLGDDPTPEQTNEFYTRLGRPDDAKGYGLVAPEGGDGAFADWASGVFHEAGLSSKQAEMIAGKWGDYSTQVAKDHTDAIAVSRVDAETALKKEWGAAYDQKLQGIDMAAEKLGFSTEQLTALRSAMGPVEALKFVDGLNTKMGDHTFENGEPHLTGHKTPAQAKQEWGELSMSKDWTDAWMDKMHPGHKAAVAKKAALMQQMAGEPPS